MDTSLAQRLKILFFGLPDQEKTEPPTNDQKKPKAFHQGDFGGAAVRSGDKAHPRG